MTATINASTSSGVVTTADNSGVLQLQTASTAALTIDGSQNVGIGTSSPGYKLDITNSSASANCVIRMTNSGTYGAFTQSVTSNRTFSYGGFDSTNGFASGVWGVRDETAAAWRMVIDSSGRVLVGLTSANTSGSNFQVSQGVTFPATQSASSDANTLDDYEEGTFTPTFTPGAGAFTTVSVTGAYTKIGRFVNVYMTLSITTVGTASGALTYSGLPFTNANSNRHVNLVRENGTTGLMGQTWIDPNATTGTVRRYDDASYTLASGQNYLLNLNYYTT